MGKSVQRSFQRYEKKYLLSVQQQTALLEGIKEHMKPDEYEKTTNCNIYYDTDTWELISKSIEKPVYKEKLRVRSYGVPKTGDKVFIEIKKKFDGIVYKRRTTMPAEYSKSYLAGNQELSPGDQIGKEIEWFQKHYQTKPKVYIAYDRTSYAGIEDPQLRITFDRNIRFRDYALDLRAGDFGETMLPDGLVLMEIKIPGTAPLWLAHLLSALQIRSTSFSKYGYFYKNYVLNRNNKEAENHVHIHHTGNSHNSVVFDLHRGVRTSRTA